MRGHLTALLQPKGEEEPKTNPSVPQQEEQADATEGKVIADQELDVDYEQEESDPEKSIKQKKSLTSNTEYAKMELTCKKTLQQMSMIFKDAESIEHLHQAKRPEIMTLWLHDMYMQLGFSPKAARLLVREQEIDSPDKLRVLTEKDADDICNVIRKPGGKNADRLPNRGQQVSVIAQANLKLAAFLFPHKCRCIFHQEVTGVSEDTVHLLAGKKRLEDNNKNTDVLPKVNNTNMAELMEAIEEYYVIRKIMIVQTLGDYTKYATPDDQKMITRMLYQTPK